MESIPNNCGGEANQPQNNLIEEDDYFKQTSFAENAQIDNIFNNMKNTFKQGLMKVEFDHKKKME